MSAEIVMRRSRLAPDTSPPPVKTMNIVFFTHPDFLGHVSLVRFSRMLAEGMGRRGHQVELLFPKPQFFNIPLPRRLRKWLGYIDQFVLFPKQVQNRLKRYPENTLFVFTDNALGPWIPLVADKPHVVHCHDFMAQESALGLIPDHPTGWTGRMYQKMIFKGYCQGQNFISGSQNTRTILQRFLPHRPKRSELVYNGLHQSFERFDQGNARAILGTEIGLDLAAGYLLHVGGNQWYKNRVGVIEMYDAWRSTTTTKLPLILIGLPPSLKVMYAFQKSPYKADIHFVTKAKDTVVNMAYSGASVFLFPSKSEGFGWPIAEAMASGCPVITTNEAPMTEVARDAGFLVPRRPHDNSLQAMWAKEAGQQITKVMSLSASERESAIQAGLENAKRFDTEHALNQVERIYRSICDDLQGIKKLDRKPQANKKESAQG